MSSRVTGAGFALIAVALLAVSLATPVVLPAQLSLFAGHPTVGEHTRGIQDVYVGFYSAQLCNSGGDGKCTFGDAATGFRIIGYGELGATGLLVITSALLALFTLRKSERRKTLATVVWIAGALALVGAAGLILYGPFREASVPIGPGMFLHGAGIIGAAIAGVIAVRPPPPIRLRVAERAPPPTAALPASALPTAQAFDRRARRGDDLLHPHDLGPEPRVGGPMNSMGPMTGPTGPTGPMVPPGDKPLFNAAPQLRPLYDAAPIQGGTGGLLPIERPQLPMQPPAPIARAQVGVIAGIPTPPPLPIDEPRMPGPYGSHGPHGPPPGFAVEPRPMPSPFPVYNTEEQPTAVPMGDHSTMRPPLEDQPTSMPFPGEPRSIPVPIEDQVTMMPFPAEPRPGPPPPPRPGARTKPPSIAPPPIPGTAPPPIAPPLGSSSGSIGPLGGSSSASSSGSFGGPPIAPPLGSSVGPPPFPSTQIGSKPRTQVSLVPPMPDIDLPIAPPTAQIAATANPELAPRESALFPRAETPLAPPPPPIAPPPRPQRDSQLPPPMRGAPSTRPPLRASVPLPARPTGPTRPVAPVMPEVPRPASPRPTIATTVPPIPAIPAIPPIPPPPMRAQTDVTDPDGRSVLDGDQATISRVPIEVGDYVSQTNVSEVPTAAGDAHADDEPLTARATYVLDTSPTGHSLADAADDAMVTDDHAAMAREAAIAARPTIQTPSPAIAARPTIIAPAQPLPGIAPPSVPPGSAMRDRPAPKLPISTAPDSLPPPKDNKQAMGPSPACPQCESPMAWVEEHLRFYCKSCRMYF